MSDAPLLRPERRQELRAVTVARINARKVWAATPNPSTADDATYNDAIAAYERTVFVDDVAALLDENEKLPARPSPDLTVFRSALENWGRHHGWCASHKGGMGMPGVRGACDCGLAAALKQMSDAIRASLGRVPLSGEAPDNG